MIQQEILNKYEKEIFELVNRLEKEERNKKRCQELTSQLRDILKELDTLHVCVNVMCGVCGEQIDIASAYDAIKIE